MPVKSTQIESWWRWHQSIPYFISKYESFESRWIFIVKVTSTFYDERSDGRESGVRCWMWVVRTSCSPAVIRQAREAHTLLTAICTFIAFLQTIKHLPIRGNQMDGTKRWANERMNDVAFTSGPAAGEEGSKQQTIDPLAGEEGTVSCSSLPALDILITSWRYMSLFCHS